MCSSCMRHFSSVVVVIVKYDADGVCVTNSDCNKGVEG